MNEEKSNMMKELWKDPEFRRKVTESRRAKKAKREAEVAKEPAQAAKTAQAVHAAKPESVAAEPVPNPLEEENTKLKQELQQALGILERLEAQMTAQAEEAQKGLLDDEPEDVEVFDEEENLKFDEPLSRANETRESEVRGNQTRGAELRYTPPELLSVPDAPPGLSYRWVSEYVRGEYQDGTMSMRYREGWRPVKKEELPNGFHVRSSEDGNVRYGGLMLMKNSERLVRQRAEYYLNRSRDAIKGANELQGIRGTGGQGLPVFEEDRSRTLEGREAMQFLTEASAES